MIKVVKSLQSRKFIYAGVGVFCGKFAPAVGRSRSNGKSVYDEGESIVVPLNWGHLTRVSAKSLKSFFEQVRPGYKKLESKVNLLHQKGKKGNLHAP
jgi:hypothetical protein